MFENKNIPPYDTVRLLVCGDVMLDRYWYGDTSRISPEAPVPVVKVQNTESRPGGAANVALNVAALGSHVTLMGFVGEDDEAAELQRLLENKNIHCDFQSAHNYSTVTKLRVLGQNQQLLRLDFEKTPVSFDNSPFIKRYGEKLSGVHMVILSDYAKGTLNQVAPFIHLAKKQGIPVLVDPKSNDFGRYAGATIITPNLKEFEAAVGPCKNDEAIHEKARQLIRAHQFDAVLITRGKDGMTVVEKSHPPIHLSAHVREVYDVTGAGDTVISVMAASLAAQASMEHSAKLANLAAGIVVRKLGAAVATIPELHRELKTAHHSRENILSEPALLLEVIQARARRETIIMTNGCFDILHAGHIDYLETAKALGDRLIVAVNDDASVTRLKGEFRPLNTLSARMEVLAALRCVDWVVPFSEDTPARLVSSILPDMLVKGGDYQIQHIAGHEAVLNNGGKVLTINLREGYSTTRLIEKIRGVPV